MEVFDAIPGGFAGGESWQKRVDEVAEAAAAEPQKEARPFDDTNVRMVPKMRRRRR